MLGGNYRLRVRELEVNMWTLAMYGVWTWLGHESLVVVVAGLTRRPVLTALCWQQVNR